MREDAAARRSAFVSDQRLDIQAEFFANRLKKRFRHLWKWARRTGVTAFRVYHRDIPELPFSVDWYDGHLIVAEYARPHDRSDLEHESWVDHMTATAARALGVSVDRLFVKRRVRQRGSAQYERSDSRRYEITIAENGLRFRVNLSDYLDTGLFLDHRDLRRYLGERAQGTRVLNLFGYTGAFTVYAAAGGARSTVTVDLSNTYLRWAEENLRENALYGPDHLLVRADVTEFLSEEAQSTNRYDWIILDPPSFSNSKKMAGTFDVQRDHADVIRRCMNLLTRRGQVVFSTNRRNFRLTVDGIRDAEATKITKLTMPEDFAGTGIHQAWIIRRTSSRAN